MSKELSIRPWRAKQYRLVISRRRTLLITLRRFQTAKSNRSQSFRQLVLPCHLGALKEVVLRVKTYKRPRHTPAISGSWLRFKTSAPFSLMLLGIAGSIFFGQQIINQRRIEPPKTFTTSALVVSKKPTVPTIASLPASVPTNISIPAVNINASVMPVGQASDGTIQMPPILDWTTGWYKYSPTPGQIGPSVIVGHVDNYKSIWVFWRLRYVQPGNDIYITRADGTTVHFKVTALKQFAQAAFPTAEVYGNINYPGLRLITCGGTFSHATGSYNQNTVVFATMVE
jgi:sortase (surface protein transpeptidase)